MIEGERLQRLMDAGRALVSDLELETVLQRLVEVAREVTDARYAALGILDQERRELERFIALGIGEADRAAIGELPHGRGVLGELIRDPKPLRLEDVGSHPRSYGFPPDHPPMKTFLGVPIMIRGEAYGNLYLTEKQGGPFDESDEEAASVLADYAAIAIENAHLYRQVDGRREELEKALRKLEATTEIVRALDGETNLHRLLELIAKRGRALVDARWLLILLEERGELEVSAVAGELDQALAGARLPLEGSVSAHVMRSRQSRRISDYVGALTVGPVRTAPRGEAALFVPLVFRGRAFGVLVAADGADQHRLSGEDAQLLESFAAGAANAVHTAKSVAAERLRQSIQVSERERRRWARELHDETLQGLGGLSVLLSAALRGPEEELSAAVQGSIEQLTIEISNLRRLITELRPAALDELGLVPAMETLADRTAATANLMVAADIDGGLEGLARLDPEVETAVYRLAQEALTNVVKHAAATRVEIGLVRRDHQVELTVTDDGSGFDPAAPVGGFGIVGMRERVELSGGTLEIDSSAGAGTRLRAVIPTTADPPEHLAPAVEGGMGAR